MEFWTQYSLFFAKAFTALIAILLLVSGLLVIIRRGKIQEKNKLEIKKLNEKYDELANVLNSKILPKKAYKAYLKEKKLTTKTAAELTTTTRKKRIFVLHFHGDIKASAVNTLREEITAILSVAKSSDEVVVRLESAGGMVSAYGLAASQLQRLKEQQIPLIVAVDKMAASGGYLMACVANRILAAPFAIIGSIGVVAQLPNFHRFLKNKDIDFEQITAGEYKRTLTLFGENTSRGREKLQEEVEQIHTLFKTFIEKNRPRVPIQQVATGEHWLATQTLQFNLIDELITSDDYLFQASKTADIYQITYVAKKTLGEKLTSAFYYAYDNIFGLK